MVFGMESQRREYRGEVLPKCGNIVEILFYVGTSSSGTSSSGTSSWCIAFKNNYISLYSIQIHSKETIGTDTKAEYMRQNLFTQKFRFLEVQDKNKTYLHNK